jgi:bifunctional UDP-N-acetylglucosamine pyrophosphorylase / glucosamine-1-phosphate N-acetyltransferase
MKSAQSKVLHALAGKPLLAHVIDAASSAEPRVLSVVYGYQGEEVKAAFADSNIAWAEQAKQLGTGHAVAQAMPALGDDAVMLVLYGDVPLVSQTTIHAALAGAQSNKLIVVTANVADPSGYGRIRRDASGSIIGIREQKDASADELAIGEINSGIMAAPVAIMRAWLSALKNDNAQGEYYLTDVVEAAVSQGYPIDSVVVSDEDEITGVNDRVQLAQLERAYQRRRTDELMRAGVTMLDPSRVDIRGDVQIEADVVLDVNVILSGRVRIASGVRVGANCVISDSSIGADTEILPNCVIDAATIGTGARVGPFSRVRPEAELGADVHVGNFVEIKKAKLGRGAKVNHLTYVGDADIGERVNVGAGTITCNYDGANKHRTVIGDDAFIGSGAMLVAPVEIGAGATIGAGSTINRDAPAGDLTVARAKQRSISGWQRPVKLKPKS